MTSSRFRLNWRLAADADVVSGCAVVPLYFVFFLCWQAQASGPWVTWVFMGFGIVTRLSGETTGKGGVEFSGLC